MAREDGGCFAEYLYLEKARMRRRGWVVAGKRQTRAWWRADLFFPFFLFFSRVFPCGSGGRLLGSTSRKNNAIFMKESTIQIYSLR